MMDGKKLDEALDDMARRHNQPPATPRDRMWENINAVRGPMREPKRQAVQPTFYDQLKEALINLLNPKVLIPIGAAAVLVLGIMIGRVSYDPTVLPENAPVVAESNTGEPRDNEDLLVATGQPANIDNTNNHQQELMYQLATIDLFSHADMRLTDFRTTSCSADHATAVPSWAQGMLLKTRLLLNTPASKDDELAPLLEELELVLAQIVSISESDCTQDMAWIRQGLEKRSTLNKLRQASTHRPDYGEI